jgi:type III restriction enzyme
VPLRAANVRTLIEQSIGRGLRLPYGKRTGVSAVDRLNIVAHDRFQEIIDEANRSDSPIRLEKVILDAPDKGEGMVSVTVSSSAEEALGLTEPEAVSAGGKRYELKPEQLTAPIFTKSAEKEAARAVLDVIQELEKQRNLVPSSGALNKPEVRQEIVAQVKERLTPVQGELLKTESVDLDDVVAKTANVVI